MDERNSVASILKYERDTPIDLNIIDSALFIKNNAWCNQRVLKVRNKKIEITGGRIFKDVKIKKNGITVIENKLVDLTVPGKFDEDVYLSIIYQFLQFKKNNNLETIPQSIICTYPDLNNNMNLKKSRQEEIRNSLDVLRHTNYKIEEVFLSSKVNNIIKEPLMYEKKKVCRVTLTETINLINYTEIKIEDFDSTELSKEIDISEDSVNSLLKGRDKRTKYFLKIKLNDHMYQNLVNKVYMLHSLKFLLEIPAVERAIFIFSYLNNGKSLKNGKFFNLSQSNMTICGVVDIAERVPLSTDDKRISKNFNRILEGYSYLKQNGYIKDYVAFKQKPIRDSYFNINFYPQQNRKDEFYKSHDLRFFDNISLVNNNDGVTESDNTQILEKFPANNFKELGEINLELVSFFDKLENKFGFINISNKKSIEKIYLLNNDAYISYNNVNLNYKKNSIILESISNWLFSYPNILDINKLLKSAIENNYYSDEYNKVILNYYKLHLNETKLFEEKIKKIKIECEEKNSDQEIKNKLELKLIEWKYDFFNLEVEMQSNYINKANKLRLKNNFVNEISDLEIYIYALSMDATNFKYLDKNLKLLFWQFKG